jgi:hypothetical protein
LNLNSSSLLLDPPKAWFMGKAVSVIVKVKMIVGIARRQLCLIVYVTVYYLLLLNIQNIAA